MRSHSRKRTIRRPQRDSRVRVSFERLESRAMLAADLSCLQSFPPIPDGSSGGLPSEGAAGEADDVMEVGSLLAEFRHRSRGDRNPIDPLDVTGDFITSPLDAIRSINVYNACGSFEIPDSLPPGIGELPFLDVDGNGLFAPSDISPIINNLNHPEGLKLGKLSELRASMTSDRGVQLDVDYSVERQDGFAKMKFAVELANGQPNQSYPIKIGGITLGEISTDDSGRASRTWTNDRNPGDALPLPGHMPHVVSGLDIAVGDQEPVELEVVDRLIPQVPERPDAVGLKIRAFLRGENGEHGQVDFHFRPSDDGEVIAMFLRVENASPGVYPVSLNDVQVGELTVNEFGRGFLRGTTDGSQGSTTLPDIKDLIKSGTKISVGDSIHGVLNAGPPILPPISLPPAVVFNTLFVNRTGRLGTVDISVQMASPGIQVAVQLNIPSLPAGTAAVVVAGLKVAEVEIDETGNGSFSITTLPEMPPGPLPPMPASWFGLPVQIGELQGHLVPAHNFQFPPFPMPFVPPGPFPGV